jgi:hypothetical protein
MKRGTRNLIIGLATLIVVAAPLSYNGIRSEIQRNDFIQSRQLAAACVESQGITPPSAEFYSKCTVTNKWLGDVIVVHLTPSFAGSPTTSICDFIPQSGEVIVSGSTGNTVEIDSLVNGVLPADCQQ